MRAIGRRCSPRIVFALISACSCILPFGGRRQPSAYPCAESNSLFPSYAIDRVRQQTILPGAPVHRFVARGWIHRAGFSFCAFFISSNGDIGYANPDWPHRHFPILGLFQLLFGQNEQLWILSFWNAHELQSRLLVLEPFQTGAGLSFLRLRLFFGSYCRKVGALFHLCCPRENGAVVLMVRCRAVLASAPLRFQRYDTRCVSVKVTGAEREGYTRPSRLHGKLGSERNKIVYFQFYALANRPHAFTSEIRIAVRLCGVVINVRFGLSSCGKKESL